MGEIEKWTPSGSPAERRRQRYINRQIDRMGTGVELAISAENGKYDLLRTRLNNAGDLCTIADLRLSMIDTPLFQRVFANGAAELVGQYMRGGRV